MAYPNDNPGSWESIYRTDSCSFLFSLLNKLHNPTKVLVISPSNKSFPGYIAVYPALPTSRPYAPYKRGSSPRSLPVVPVSCSLSGKNIWHYLTPTPPPLATPLNGASIRACGRYVRSGSRFIHMSIRIGMDSCMVLVSSDPFL